MALTGARKLVGSGGAAGLKANLERGAGVARRGRKRNIAYGRREGLNRQRQRKQ
jgi:hypothetical protein